MRYINHNCVQLGINVDAEYLYLAQPNWRELMPQQDTVKQLPDIFKGDMWHYTGVDSDVVCIAEHLADNKHSLNVDWVCACIAAEHTHKHVNSWFLSRGFGVGVITLEMLLTNIPNVQERGISVLAMDIEGYEYEILRSYNWSIKPKFIAVEAHTRDHYLSPHYDSCPLELIACLKAQGYQLYKQIPNVEDILEKHTDYHGELQFILKG